MSPLGKGLKRHAFHVKPVIYSCHRSKNAAKHPEVPEQGCKHVFLPRFVSSNEMELTAQPQPVPHQPCLVPLEVKIRHSFALQTDLFQPKLLLDLVTTTVTFCPLLPLYTTSSYHGQQDL